MTEKNLTEIALNLNTEDACFYDITTGGDSVSGFFEYVVERHPYGEEDVLASVPFIVDIKDVLASAVSLKFITDYEKTHKGLVAWEAGDFGKDICTPAADYISYMVEFQPAATQKIISEAIKVEWEKHLARLADQVSYVCGGVSFVERFLRGELDAEFGNQVQELASIIKSAQKKEAA